MAGKSNVIDLFRFIYDMTFPRQPGTGALSNAVFARGGFGELLWKGGDEQIIEIELFGTTLAHGPEWQWEYSISVQGKAFLCGATSHGHLASRRCQRDRCGSSEKGW